MSYQVVFDIAKSGGSGFPVHTLALVVVGLCLVMLHKRFPNRWRAHPKASLIFSFVFLGLSLAITTMIYIATRGNYSELVEAENAGRVSVAEGKVKNFVPMPATGHAMEHFCVAESCFMYSDFVITGGFNNTSSLGGPIREGKQVRVTYVGNKIVKLEVANNQ